MRRYSDRVVARSVTSVPNDVSSSRVARCAARVGCMCETGQPASVNVCRRQTSHTLSSPPHPSRRPHRQPPAVARAPGDWEGSLLRVLRPAFAVAACCARAPAADPVCKPGKIHRTAKDGQCTESERKRPVTTDNPGNSSVLDQMHHLERNHVKQIEGH